MANTQIPAKGLSQPNQFRNIIINGDMSIAQRATSVSNITTGFNTVDRWRYLAQGSATARFTQSQSTTVPSGQGFSHSLKMECTTADTDLSTNQHMYLYQGIERYFTKELLKGTSDAKQLTLSFWVRSNKTGTYTVTLYDNPNARHVASTYTIDTADTWEKKIITYPADTSGTISVGNQFGIGLYFNLGLGTDRSDGTLATTWEAFDDGNWGAGQTVNLADSTSNEWYLTGVQLEISDVASEFNFIPYDISFQRCRRYFQVMSYQSGGVVLMANSRSTTLAQGGLDYEPLRVAPTIVLPPASKTDGIAFLDSDGAYPSAVGTNTAAAVSNINCRINGTGYTGLTNDSISWLYVTGNQEITLEAELS